MRAAVPIAPHVHVERDVSSPRAPPSPATAHVPSPMTAPAGAASAPVAKEVVVAPMMEAKPKSSPNASMLLRREAAAGMATPMSGRRVGWSRPPIEAMLGDSSTDDAVAPPKKLHMGDTPGNSKGLAARAPLGSIDVNQRAVRM